MSRPFIPERLKEARIEAGLSMTELAERADISKSSISQFEKGVTSPKYQTVLQLGLVLGKKDAYFYTPINRQIVEESPVFFRSFSSKTAKSQQIALIKKAQVQDIIQYLFSLIKERPVSIPDDIFVSDPLVLDEAGLDIDALALRLREYWDLGEEPIENLAYLLENKGIICCSIKLPDKIDAFSVTIRLRNSSTLRPIIIFDDESNYYRQRFDIAHELGHFILHSMLDAHDLQENLKLVESQANRFASAFLLPATRFLQSVFSTSMDALISLKRHWDVSIAAILRRMFDLGIIDRNRYTNLNIEISKNKWRMEEPMDREHEKEKTYFLSKAFDFIISKRLADINSILFELGYDAMLLAEVTKNNALFRREKTGGRIDFVFST
nr:XRE family transcriptional regulator [uncultured Sphaerochaeta sp.]